MNETQSQEILGNEAIVWRAQPDTAKAAARVDSFDLGRGLQKAVCEELHVAWAACGEFEWVALGYLAVSSALIVVFGQNLAHPLQWLAGQSSVAAVILTLCWIEARVSRTAQNLKQFGQFRLSEQAERPMTWRGGNACPTFIQKFWHFWRHWYPHLFFLFCFEELGHFMRLVTPEWQDAKLIAFDHWLTGVHPSVWLEQFAAPGRNEFMQFAYITYFLYLLALGGILYHRKEWSGYWSVMTYSGMAYAIGYVIAICFPIESPWFAMAGMWRGQLRGGVFTSLINFIEHYGRVRGAAFPSEHVAGSVAALWGAWRHRRWLFWVMLPLAVCMCASTVWGRYHYVADVFGGVATGTLGYVLGSWVMRRGRQSTVEIEREHAPSIKLV